MTKWVVSRYNHKLSWLLDYTGNPIVYDRSDDRSSYHIFSSWNILRVENKGSDIYDKLTWIIDTYDNLPEVAILIKANLFDYIKPKEFDLIKDKTSFTPILTQHHKTYSDEYSEVCFYKDGMYYERNDLWYLQAHPVKNNDMQRAFDLAGLLGISNILGTVKYVPFAPGSNYILPKENILKHSKEFYIKLRSYIDWDVYPGECQIIERGLYKLWSL